MRHSVDVHVGKRIRQARWMQRMTQTQLGEQAGCKFQQIQKYETGANRVSASRLWNIASALNVPVSFFFDGLDAGEDGETCESDTILADKQAIDLLHAYQAIPEPQRRRLFDLARVLAEAA